MRSKLMDMPDSPVRIKLKFWEGGDDLPLATRIKHTAFDRRQHPGKHQNAV